MNSKTVSRSASYLYTQRGHDETVNAGPRGKQNMWMNAIYSAEKSAITTNMNYLHWPVQKNRAHFA